MISIKVIDLDFNKCFKLKPFFFFYEQVPFRNVLFNGKLFELSFSQKHDELIINSSINPPKNLIERIAFCLGIKDDLSSFYELVSSDPVLSEFEDSIHGLRLFSAFSDFEGVIGTVCSQFTSFPAYKRMMACLMSRFNRFPEPSELSLSLLKSCGFGFRAENALSVTKAFTNNEPLINAKGWGEYSDALYNLFQKRDYSSFYYDSLIKKIILKNYDSTLKTKSEFLEFAENQWGSWKGLAEVYLQKFLRDVKA